MSALKIQLCEDSACKIESDLPINNDQQLLSSQITTSYELDLNSDVIDCSHIFDTLSEVKNEVNDSASPGCVNLNNADCKADIRECSVLFNRPPNNFDNVSTLTTGSLANSNAQSPVYLDRPIAQLGYSSFLIYGDLPKCLRSTQLPVSAVNPRTANLVQNDQLTSLPKELFLKPKKQVLPRSGLKTILLPKPGLLLNDQLSVNKCNKSAKKILIAPESEGTLTGFVLQVTNSDNAESDVSLTTVYPNEVKVEIKEPPSPEIGDVLARGDELALPNTDLQIDSHDDFELQFRKDGATAYDVQKTSSLKVPLICDVPGLKHELYSVISTNTAEITAVEEHCQEFYYCRNEVPELGSNSIFSPLPVEVESDVEAVVDELREAIGYRDSELSYHFLTLGADEEQLIKVVPDDSESSFTVNTSGRTYRRKPLRRSLRKRHAYVFGDDFNQMQFVPNRRNTTLPWVDLNGELLQAALEVDAEVEWERQMLYENGNHSLTGATSVATTSHVLQKRDVLFEKCKFCGKRVEAGVAYRVHTASHKSYCPHCCKRFASVGALESHMKKEHPNFRCRYCFLSTFTSMSSFKYHEEVHQVFHHMELDPASYYSDSCHVEMMAKSDTPYQMLRGQMNIGGVIWKMQRRKERLQLEAEIKQRKLRDAALAEPKAKLKRGRQKKLKPPPVLGQKVVVSKEQKLRDKKPLCHICGAKPQLKMAEHLKRHRIKDAKRLAKIKQRNEKRVRDSAIPECKYCGKVYTSLLSLKWHIKLVHKKSTAVVCEQCGKSFSSSQTLSKHMLIHSGVQPYECSFCGKRFRTPYNKTQHENVHRGVKPYKCEFCSKDFAQVAALIQHRRKHTGVKVTEEYERKVAERAKRLAATEFTAT